MIFGTCFFFDPGSIFFDFFMFFLDFARFPGILASPARSAIGFDRRRRLWCALGANGIVYVQDRIGASELPELVGVQLLIRQVMMRSGGFLVHFPYREFRPNGQAAASQRLQIEMRTAYLYCRDVPVRKRVSSFFFAQDDFFSKKRHSSDSAGLRLLRRSWKVVFGDLSDLISRVRVGHFQCRKFPQAQFVELCTIKTQLKSDLKSEADFEVAKSCF